MAASQVKPFQFQNLKQLSRKQVDLQAGVLRYLPEALPQELFVQNVLELLEKYMGCKVDLELTALREPKFLKYCHSIPDPTVMFVFSCMPLGQKAFLQVDFALAHILVDRMLGGKGDYPKDLNPLTPIEKGVLQYLVLKNLNLLAECVQGNEVQFRLDSMISDNSQLLALGEEEELVALLSIQVTIGKKAGFIRMALPHPLVEGLVANLTPQERSVTPGDLKRLERMVDVKMPIWIELGHLDINSKDLSRLEAGDVILLDKLFVEIGEEGITGPVTVRVMDGVGGGLQGQIVASHDDFVNVKIDEIF